VKLSLIILGLVFVAVITLLMLNIYHGDSMFDFTNFRGELTLFGTISIATFAFCVMLVITALILHAIDNKSREAVVARRLLKRAKNAVRAHRQSMKLISQLEKFIYTLENTIEHKKKKIKKLRDQLLQNYVRIKLALKLQSHINSQEHQIRGLESQIDHLKRHIQHLNERPTLQEKLAYRKALKMEKWHKKLEREKARNKAKDIRKIIRSKQKH
jgi:flagellar biosynthesis chaperone FliJ